MPDLIGSNASGFDRLFNPTQAALELNMDVSTLRKYAEAIEIAALEYTAEFDDDDVNQLAIPIKNKRGRLYTVDSIKRIRLIRQMVTESGWTRNDAARHVFGVPPRQVYTM